MNCFVQACKAPAKASQLCIVLDRLVSILFYLRGVQKASTLIGLGIRMLILWGCFVNPRTTNSASPICFPKTLECTSS